MPTTKIFKCRVCGGESYCEKVMQYQNQFGLRQTRSGFVCETCSVMFDDPSKFTEQKAQQEVEFSKIRDISYEDAKKEIRGYCKSCEGNTSISNIIEELNIDVDIVKKVISEMPIAQPLDICYPDSGSSSKKKIDHNKYSREIQNPEIEFSQVRELSFENAKKEIDTYISKCKSKPSISNIAENLKLDIDMITRVVLAKKIPTNDNIKIPFIGPLDAHYIKESEFPADTSTKKQTDPTGRKAHDAGAKLDNGKVLAGVLGDFSLALTAVAEVGTYGINKYSRGGWQHVPDAQTRYTDALWRHLLAESTEPVDPESELLHSAHLAWNSLAKLELMLRENKTNYEFNGGGCINHNNIKRSCDKCELNVSSDRCKEFKKQNGMIYYS